MKKRTLVALFVAVAVGSYGCGEAHHDHTHTAQEGHTHTEGEAHEHTHDHNHDHNHGHDHDHAHDHTAESTNAEEACPIQALGLTTEIVRRAPFAAVIPVTAQIQPASGNELTLSATHNGVVRIVPALQSEGSSVAAQRPLLYLSSQGVQEGDPALRAKIAYDTAERALRRADSLVVGQLISARDYEALRADYEIARTAYAGVSQRHSAQGVALSSPMAGYVKQWLVSPGEYVSVGAPLVVVAQDRRLSLRAEVPVHKASALRSVYDARLRTAQGDRIYTLSEMNGRLLSVGRNADTATGSWVAVTFEMDNVGDLLPSSFVEAYLLCRSEQEAITVPLTALIEEQGVYSVYVKSGEEKFDKREVRLGERDGLRVEVLQGLHEGEEVVSQGAMRLKLASLSTAIPHGHDH